MSRLKPAAPWPKLVSLLCPILACVSPAVGGIPEPLSLEQAIAVLGERPAASASSEVFSRLPRRPSLYLDCENLAYASAPASETNADGVLRVLLRPSAARRLDVAERFFDVLLADFSFASESEAMAVAYVQFDRASARQELGQFSELRVLELEATYQGILQRRTASETSQQLTRSRLALALGHPDELPRTLSSPVLPEPPDPLPDPDDWVARALAGEGLQPGGLQGVESELREEVTELLLRLKVLAAAERSVRVESRWRDLKLDESRALYDLEVTADLGYSMSQQTRTRMQEQRIQYCQALTWAGLRELVGQPLWTIETQEP